MTDTPHTSSHTARRGRSLAAVLVVAGTFGLAACSDSPVAPSTSGAEFQPSAGLLSGAGVTITGSVTVNGVTTTTAIVDPQLNVKLDGDGYMINIPDKSICDPLTTSYGAAHWDAPCTVATLPITFTVKSWTDATGSARTEISPDVRFSPAKMVRLHLKSLLGSLTSGTSINWCPTGASRCVNEALTDASVATQRDASRGTVNRRVKHFSGYMVSVGLTGEGDSTETDSTPTYP